MMFAAQISRFANRVFTTISYASRMVAPRLQGRAIAVAMVGTPLALSLGIPAGTLLGTLVGWRLSFAIMTGLTLVLLIWARWQLPDFAGQATGKRLGLRQVLTLPGIRPVLWVTFTYVLAHNILYTYIAPLLVGQDPRFPAMLMASVNGHIQGNRFAKCAFDKRNCALPTNSNFWGAR